MQNLNEIKAIVRDYLANTTAEVDQVIFDSINYLSNFFSVSSIDESQSTIEDSVVLNIPDNSISIKSIFINSDEVRKLKKINDLETVKLSGTNRWYISGGKIQFTNSFSAVYSTKIFYEKGFKKPTTEIETDVPFNLLELVYLGSQYRYYNKLVSTVAIKKDELPDIKAKDLIAIRDDIKEQYLEIMKTIQIRKQV